MAHPLVEATGLADLERTLDRLDGRAVQATAQSASASPVDLHDLCDSLKAHQDRGNPVPWQKA